MSGLKLNTNNMKVFRYSEEYGIEIIQANDKANNG